MLMLKAKIKQLEEIASLYGGDFFILQMVCAISIPMHILL